MTPNRERHRKRIVLVMKYLKSTNNEPTEKDPSINTVSPPLKFFEISKSYDARKDNHYRSDSLYSRPATVKSNPTKKRFLSKVDFESQTGSKIFDISDVLNVTHGDVKLKSFKSYK